MKYLYLSLLLLNYINEIFANNNCRSFPIQYYHLVQEAPTEKELSTFYLNNECDKRYYFAGKMINAYQEGDLTLMHSCFEKIIYHSKQYPKSDELSLLLIYLYSNYLEETGDVVIAGSYYSYLKLHSQSNTALHFLAKVAHAGVYLSQEAIILLTNDIMNKVNSSQNITPEQRMAIIMKSGHLLPNDLSVNFYKNNYLSYKEYPSKKITNLFLSHIEHGISQSDEAPPQKILDEIRNNTSKFALGGNKGVWNNTLAIRSLNDHDYGSYLKFSQNALLDNIGPFESKEQLIELIKQLQVVPVIELFRYARSNLYQTRLGKGIEPVIDAFDIYTFGYNNLLKDKLLSVNLIVSEKDNNTIIKYTPLIVGTYLYQNTNDLSYLSRSISILDGFSSGGSQYWTLARKKMRTDKRFTAAIQEERALAEGMKYLAPGTTLAEIRQRQLAFEEHREQMSEDFSEFYEELTTGYKIDLKEVQQDLAVDTTGLVAFYQNETILYRLFIAPDTIDIATMNGNRAEVLELTSELAETIPSGKSIAHTKEASRRLYQLLFAGLDSMLPERMHIVTTGALEDVPFSALRRDIEDGDPRYLGLECAISRQTSIREMQLLEELDLDPRYAQPLGMAPDFSNEFLQASDLRQAGFKLPPLVFNTEEVQELEDRSAGQYYYDATATINHYVQNASDYGIIHLATHAISSQTDGLRSHLYLLDDDGEPTQLYASDIGDQTLNANLVVLSACETGGGGRHINEGKVGLTKAYLAAGARSVVSSNWAVDDHATAELMSSFYARLESGDAPHEALQFSRKAYLERHPDAAPYKWAAFEAYGGMKPVSWNQQNSWWPTVGFGVGGILLLLLGTRALRQRAQIS